MARIFTVLLLATTLSACTKTYQPEDVSIYDKHVRDFVVSGDVAVSSVNLDEPPAVIWDNLVTFKTSYTDIANSIAKQLNREIDENSTVDGNLNKNVFIQVDNFYLEPHQQDLKIHMNFTVIGDRGFEKHFAFEGQPTEKSGEGITRSFDNAIAYSVEKILKNSAVLNYLANTETRSY
ncbi:Uncharacterised protein [BD1-7 clade bacterium]|uniref:Lipoprotein n=1 Tax=BD1-7 clade bacterium TaxID=2029982 RepID=A0A5S9N5G0_9GAMM|nr:Uncharacterised protein [BD1-7 clade bacterium]CAA0085082.1 Uncharacterised protein [BD1-7 clade bacterium]